MTYRKNVYKLMVFGLMLSLLLSACASSNPDNAVPTSVATSTVSPVRKNILQMWSLQAPTTLNPHLTNSISDREPARVVYEPLAAFNQDGELIPILATEIPSLENGGLDAAGKSVIWKLRAGITWSDGKAFSADDVLFTYTFIMNPEINAATKDQYAQIEKVEVQDALTVKIAFKDSKADWKAPFVGVFGVILPKHIFEMYKGANARKEAQNALPIGTGPYRVVEPGIKPQEVILLGSQVVKTTKIVYEPNPYYRFPEKKLFDQIVWRGGGTVNEAARFLYKGGNLDVAYNFDTIDPTKLSELQTDKGGIERVFGPSVVRILLNRTNPNRASEDGEFSSVKVPHPFFSDKKVREAIAYAIDRDAIAQLYGKNGIATYANLVLPIQYQSKKSPYIYNLEKAKALLDEAGCLDTDGDGFREKNGLKMKLVFQSSTNNIFQAAQEIIRQSLKKIGIDVQIKIIDASIMNAADTSNPDNFKRFNADMIILPLTGASPNPSNYMVFWTCASIPQQANKWSGLNVERWCNNDYDDLFQKAKAETDSVKRQAMFIQLNDMLIEDVVMIPVVWRANALGVSQRLKGLSPTPWDYVTWNIQDWHFVTP